MLSARGHKILGCLLDIYCSRLHACLPWLAHNFIFFYQASNHLIWMQQLLLKACHKTGFELFLLPLSLPLCYFNTFSLSETKDIYLKQSPLLFICLSMISVVFVILSEPTVAISFFLFYPPVLSLPALSLNMCSVLLFDAVANAFFSCLCFFCCCCCLLFCFLFMWWAF